ncbi:MAG: hypothetical protein ACEB74_02975 [Desulfovibrio aminophilus]|uniref:hypothetical protein n=1 Tax=Desulfovibrio aminophilus TaxID=81425 RepID=UPI0039EB8425
MTHILQFLVAQAPGLEEPTLDRHFVQRIGESFGGGGAVTPALLVIAAGVLVFCALLIILVRMRRKIQAGRERQEPPIGWLMDRPSIMEVMENALMHRSKVELSFHQQDERRRAVACALLEVSPESMLLELPAGIQPGASWVGRHVDGFFQIGKGPATQSRKIFYHFTSEIAAVPRARKQAAVLSVAIPDKIVLSQKRAFLRMAPPSSAIPVFEILPHDDATLAHCLSWFLPPPEEDGKQPSPPPRLPSLGRFAIKDISGGGARVEARIADKESLQRLNLVAGTSCYVALELLAERPRRYVLAATVRRVFRDTGGVQELGLEFTSRLKGRDQGTGLPSWKALKGKGEESIESWVVKKYLEVYREKGVEPTA